MPQISWSRGSLRSLTPCPFGRRLVSLAVAHGDVMQAQLAEKLGVGRPYLVDLICGRDFPSKRFMRRVASAYSLLPHQIAALGGKAFKVTLPENAMRWRAAHQRQRMTQGELAEKVGVTVVHINRVLTGKVKPSPGLSVRIDAALT